MYDDQMKYADEIAVLAREAQINAAKIEGADFQVDADEIATLARDLEGLANKLHSAIRDAEDAEERRQLFPEEYYE